MKLCSRLLVLLAVLAVPLALALASQTLAARPGPPPVADGSIRLPAEPDGRTDLPRPPETRPAPPPVQGPASRDDAPRVVTPVVPRQAGDDAELPDDDADDGAGSEDEPDRD